MQKSPVVKGAETGGRVRTVVERRERMADTLAECNRLLEQAAAEAARIEQQARADAEALIEAARRQAQALGAEEQRRTEQLRSQVLAQARQEGLAQGFQQAAAAAQTILEHLRSLAQEAQLCLQETIFASEPELVRLALHIADRIIDAQIDADSELVRRVVRQSLEQAGDRESITLLVNPEDFERIQSYVPDLQDSFPDIEAISVQPDARVDPGGCMVQTRLGVIDARIARQKALLRQAVLGG